MSNVLAIIILAGVTLWMGFYILQRMPTSTARAVAPKAIRGEDWELHGTIESLTEENFQIVFADYWTLGRSFSLHLHQITSQGLTDSEVPELKLTVIPTGEGFDSEAFGRCTILDTYRNAVIHIPYPVARQMLEDIRHRERQTILLAGRRVENSTRTALITHLVMH